MSTSVALSVTCAINDKPVILNAGDIGSLTTNGLVLSLTRPVDMGTLAGFAKWLKSNLGVTIDLKAPDGLPEAFRTPFESFITGDVTVDTLTINQPAKAFQLGMSYKLGSPLDLIGGLQFNGIGLLVTRQPSSTLTAPVTADGTAITVQPGDGALIGTGQIRIGGEVLTVTKVTGDTLTVTRGTNAAQHPAGAPVTRIITA